MRPDTTKAIKKLRAGKTGLSEKELRDFFNDVRALSDEALLVQPTTKRPKIPADPTVASVTKSLKTVEASAPEKANLLLEAAVAKGVPPLKARGIADAVKKLKGHLDDQQIVQMAISIVQELAEKNGPEQGVA